VSSRLPGPDSDGAVIRVPGTLKGVVVSSDGNGRYGRLDPYLGAAHAVAEAARNVAVTGAWPMAVTNCLNFGNPERGEVMWQFAESVRGMGDACIALATPVTGGNVSFYNESGDSAIDPTPVIGMLGLLSDYRLRVPGAFPQAGLAIYLLGETAAELGGSEFADVVLDEIGAMPPGLDLERERALIELLASAAAETMLASAHDCSDGGLAIALAECAIGRGHGFAVMLVTDLPAHVALFSESGGRAVVSVAPVDEERFGRLAAALGVPATRIGETGGPRAVIEGAFDLTVTEMALAWDEAIPRLLGEAV
jgi:phosphoribosylformylglycinamidine synthase subunit PurL